MGHRSNGTEPTTKKYPCGDYGSYNSDGCRCRPCRKAMRDYMRNRSRLLAYGQWQPLVDAAPARHHVLQLRASGISLARIATLASVSYTAITCLIYGEPFKGKPPTGRMRTETSARILAIKPTVDLVDPVIHLDATGTCRRIQALMTLGWSGAALASRLGVHPSTLVRILQRRNLVQASTYLAVCALYDDLWKTAPPAETREQRTSASQTRARAARNRWMPPGAWDDDSIDDPTAEPDLGQPVRRTVALAEDSEELIRSQGYSLAHAAERLGVDTNHLQKIRDRTSAARSHQPAHRGVAALTT